ncbi:LegC family aminotransferase [Paenibacillus rigui]|uniref:Aminotransferase DegT n=1 Tax=Paenibacillus rigui TaxID=554312 RepID=A0A229UIC9_9BACL|nr:LegC family aminotransferase [Paenibacillus rigui]OXM83055.1 aminotransferase DegT [Paenibacillus rigui]
MSQQLDSSKIIAAMQSVLPKNELLIPLHEPVFGGNEWAYVKDCLDTGWVSSKGRYVEWFENQMTAFTGAKYAVAVVNGTAALHISLIVSGVAANDEVLLPTLTFVATANAVRYCGAVPHFIDSEEQTLGLDTAKLEDYLGRVARLEADDCINKYTGRRIKALIAMHTFGHPVDLDPLLELCKRYKLELVEDAAEALGSFYKSRHVGNFGRMSAISFNGNKIMTTGGGGVILTNEAPLAQMAKHLTTTAKLPHPWEYNHDYVGYNYRMPNLNAAVGCAQLEQLPGFLQAKRALADRYKQSFSQINGVTFLSEPGYAQSNYWLNALVLDKPDRAVRDLLLKITNDIGFMTRPCWTLLHRLPIYHDCPAMDLSMAEKLEDRIMNLPSSANLYVKEHD